MTFPTVTFSMPNSGQATSANSLPVVIASDQSAVPVTGMFWQATQPITAASLPLPNGAAISSSFGYAFPSSGTAIGIFDGTSMQPLKRASTYSFTGISGGNALLTTAQKIKSTTSVLRALDFYNPNFSIVWVQIYNSATAPALGTSVPALSYPIPAGGWWDKSFDAVGIEFANGLYIAATTTQAGGITPGTGLSGNVYYQ